MIDVDSVTVVFYPYTKDYLDPSQIEKGNPDFTDFLSWLLANVGKDNFNISFTKNFGDELIENSEFGWKIKFKYPDHAMLFKLTW